MKKDSVKVALLKLIIQKYPEPLTTMEVAQPKGYGISGRNRLNELSKDYGFHYEHYNKKYHFHYTWKSRFKEILVLELFK